MAVRGDWELNRGSAGGNRDLPLVLHARCITGTGGGPEKTILNSPRFLPPLGYRAECAFLHPPGDPGFDIVQARALHARAPVIGISDSGIADLSAIRALIRLCRDRRVAIWHGHDYKTNILGLVVRKFWPMRLVTTVHGWVQYTPRLHAYYALDKWAVRRYEEIICVSEDLRQVCLGLGLSGDRCHLIHNAIDIEEYRRSASREEARRMIGAPSQGVMLGAVGRLSPEKGFDLLIRAIGDLKDHRANVTLWIVGEGPARASLEALIAKLDLYDHVRLLGFMKDVEYFYQALDIYVMSSIREGLPNSVLEAMAFEVPVLATRIAGIPRLIDDGVNGLLVPPGAVDALVFGVRRFLEDRDMREKFGKKGRETIERSFSFNLRMRKIAAVYNQVLCAVPGVTGSQKSECP